MTPQQSAWYETKEAVRKGDLTRPATCDRCAVGGRIEAHHDDYAKPLDVRWLCRKCHRARHRELGHRPRPAIRRGPIALNREGIVEALATAKGSPTKAGELLGISRMTIWRRMKKYGIEVQRIVAA